MPTERELAHQTQEKFQFYVLGLIFTLLAASVQTAKFGVSSTATSLELFGWAALLIAGVVLMWRVEWDSPIRMLHTKLAEAEHEQAQLIQAQGLGQQNAVTHMGAQVPIAQRLADLAARIPEAKAKVKRMERLDAIKYTTARIAFLLGVTGVVLARGLPPAVELFGYQLH
jgi:hypothetical protein